MSKSLKVDAAPGTEEKSSGGEERRQFLRQAICASSGLILGLSTPGATTAGSGSEKSPNETSPEAVLKLGEHKGLSKVGGSEVVETTIGKIIVARTEESSFVACSAICTHRGCEVAYEHDSKQFVCPCHNARFDLDGKVVRGPAKKPLQSYAAAAAVSVSIAVLKG